MSKVTNDFLCKVCIVINVPKTRTSYRFSHIRELIVELSINYKQLRNDKTRKADSQPIEQIFKNYFSERTFLLMFITYSVRRKKNITSFLSNSMTQIFEDKRLLLRKYYHLDEFFSAMVTMLPIFHALSIAECALNMINSSRRLFLILLHSVTN